MRISKGTIETIRQVETYSFIVFLICTWLLLDPIIGQIAVGVLMVTLGKAFFILPLCALWGTRIAMLRGRYGASTAAIISIYIISYIPLFLYYLFLANPTLSQL